MKLARFRSLDFDLDSAVFRTTFPGLIVCDRFAFAESLSGNSATVNTLLHDIVLNRSHTPLGQPLVVRLGAEF